MEFFGVSTYYMQINLLHYRLNKTRQFINLFTMLNAFKCCTIYFANGLFLKYVYNENK